MDKSQAVNRFWSSFGLPAYDVYSVPTGKSAPDFPYITYDTKIDNMGAELPLNGSLWYRSTSWGEISRKAEEIDNAVSDESPYLIPINGGYLWIKRGSPFAQRMGDDSDDMIRRILINITAEFLTN